MKKIILPSGFIFDYTNLFSAWGVTEADVHTYFDSIANAVKAAVRVRTTGVVEGHLSKDGQPEAVLFPQLPYIEDKNLNNETVLKRLEDLGQHAKESVDAVVSFGIGGSYLGGKVLFDVHCGEFWNQKSEAERDGYPKLYFSGNNVDPHRTNDLIETLKRSAAHKGSPYTVMLILISKSGSTIEPMSNFMVVQEALAAAGIKVEVVAVTDPRTDRKRNVAS